MMWGGSELEGVEARGTESPAAVPMGAEHTQLAPATHVPQHRAAGQHGG